jgi:serine/threonine-protein kinase
VTATDPLARMQRLDLLLDEALSLEPSARALFTASLAAENGDDAQALERLLHAALTDDQLLDGASWARLDPQMETTHLPGDQIGPYRLKRKLGSGGMGEVWLVEHVANATLPAMALKLIRSVLSVEVLRARLVRERDILIRLTHPHIARLLDSGISEAGEPYLALEFVPGQSILTHAQLRKLGIRERVGLIAQVADAVAYAQTQLVVHRDIKPQNILVTAAGVVKLLDFGIAKLLDDSFGATQLTGQAQRMLTPAYAAPEQLRGDAVSTASDVYSLGVVMHELLLGVRPKVAEAGSIVDPSKLARTHQAPGLQLSAAVLARGLRGDLDCILARALAPEPAARYPSASELAQDLQAYLAQRPLRTRPDRIGYRVMKLIARHRFASAALLIATSAMLIGAVTSWQQAQIAAREGVRAAYAQGFLERLFSNDLPGAPRDQLPSTAELLQRGSAQALSDTSAEPGARMALLLAIARIQTAQRDRAGAEQSWLAARLLLGQVSDAAAWRGPSIDAELANSRAANDPGNRAAGLDALAPAIDSASALNAPLDWRVEIQNGLVNAQVDAGMGEAARASSARALKWLSAFEGQTGKAATSDPALTDKRARLRLNTLTQAVVAATFEQQPIAGTEALAREAVALAIGHFGEVHAETAYAHMRLALVLRIDGDVGQALDVAAHASDIARGAYPGLHPQLARILEEHARILMRLRNNAAGIALWREVLAIRSAQGASASFSVARTQTFLSSALLRVGQNAEAAEVGAQAIAGLRRSVGINDAFYLDALSYTATALIRLDRRSEARALLPAPDAPIPQELDATTRWRFIDLQSSAVGLLPLGERQAALRGLVTRVKSETPSPREIGRILLDLAALAIESGMNALAGEALAASEQRLAARDPNRLMDVHALLSLLLKPMPWDRQLVQNAIEPVRLRRGPDYPAVRLAERTLKSSQQK